MDLATTQVKKPQVNTETALLEFKKVEKTYKLGTQEIKALRGIDFSIQSGEFIAIAGPSGSGKSTFLNLVSLIDTATAGCIRYNGINMFSLSDNEITAFRNKKIGIVFQNFNLIPVLSAEENVAFALQVQRTMSTKESLKSARAILKEVGLGEHLKHRPANLSGGQRQRVAIARALVTNPEIVVADEPTSALDSKTGMEIIELMRQLNNARKTTFVIATHDPRVIEKVNYVINIEDGLIKN